MLLCRFDVDCGEVSFNTTVGRRISEDAFDEVLHILHDILVAHKMEEADIKAVADLVLSHKKDIVEIQNSVRVHKV